MPVACAAPARAPRSPELPLELWQHVAAELPVADAIHLDQALGSLKDELWPPTALEAHYARLIGTSLGPAPRRERHRIIQAAKAEHHALQTGVWRAEAPETLLARHENNDHRGSYRRAGFIVSARRKLADGTPVLGLTLEPKGGGEKGIVHLPCVTQCELMACGTRAVVVYRTQEPTPHWHCALLSRPDGKPKLSRLARLDVPGATSRESFCLSPNGTYVVIRGALGQAPKLVHLHKDGPRALAVQWSHGESEWMTFNKQDDRLAILTSAGTLHIFALGQFAQQTPLVPLYTDASLMRQHAIFGGNARPTSVHWHQDGRLVWLSYNGRLWTAWTPDGQTPIELPVADLRDRGFVKAFSALLANNTKLLQCVGGDVTLHTAVAAQASAPIVETQVLSAKTLPEHDIAVSSYDPHHRMLTLTTNSRAPTDIWRLDLFGPGGKGARAMQGLPHSLDSHWAWRQDGQGAACVDRAREDIVVYRFGDQRVQAQRLSKSGAVAADFSLDGQFLVTSHNDGWLHLWENRAERTDYVRPFAKHTDPVVALAFEAEHLRVAGIDSHRVPVAWAFDSGAFTRTHLNDLPPASAWSDNLTRLRWRLRPSQANAYRLGQLSRAARIFCAVYTIGSAMRQDLILGEPWSRWQSGGPSTLHLFQDAMTVSWSGLKAVPLAAGSELFIRASVDLSRVIVAQGLMQMMGSPQAG